VVQRTYYTHNRFNSQPFLTWSDVGISLPEYITSGECRAHCPKCSPQRQKRTDRCLSVNLDKRVWLHLAT
jgi:hypothetical protein